MAWRFHGSGCLVNGSLWRDNKVLDTAQYKALRKRCRTTPTQGDRELPEIPLRTSGQRGRIANSDAHNLWGRLKTYAGGCCASPNIPKSPSPTTVPKGPAHDQGQAERFRPLPNYRMRERLLPDLQLPEIHGRNGNQSTVRHSDRPRRQRRSPAYVQRTISLCREYANRSFPVV